MAERAPEDAVAEVLRRAVGEPEGDLTDVLARGARARRAWRRRRMVASGLAVGLAAAVAAVAFVVLRPQASTPEPVHPAPSIEGTYTGHVTGAAGRAALNGQWRLTFNHDGTVAVVAPPGYGGLVSGVSYRVTGDVVRTDLMVQDLCSGDSLGSYRWVRAGDHLTFSAVRESCAARSRLLAGQEWTAVR